MMDQVKSKVRFKGQASRPAATEQPISTPPAPQVSAAEQPAAKPTKKSKKLTSIKQAWEYFYSLPSNHPHYQKLRQFFFDEYMPACKRKVREYAFRKLPTYALIDEDDLNNAVAARLWTAITKFNPHLGLDFWQFFNASGRSYVHGAIIDELRTLQDFPRSVAKRKRQLGESFKLLRQIIGYEPGPEDFCDYFGWDRRDELMDPLLWRAVFNQSCKAPTGGDEELTDEMRFADRVSTTGNDNPDEVKADVINDAIQRRDAILSVIADKEQKRAVFLRYWLGYTNEQIAKDLGCSISTALERKNSGEAAIIAHFTRERLAVVIAR